MEARITHLRSLTPPLKMTAIAAEAGCSIAYAETIVRACGLQRRPPAPATAALTAASHEALLARRPALASAIEAGASRQAIAGRYGVTVQTLRNWIMILELPSRPGRAPVVIDHAKYNPLVRAGIESGYSRAAIAARLGLSPTWVAKCVQNLGLGRGHVAKPSAGEPLIRTDGDEFDSAGGREPLPAFDPVALDVLEKGTGVAVLPPGERLPARVFELLEIAE